MSELPGTLRAALIVLVALQLGLQIYGLFAWWRLYRSRTQKDYVILVVVLLGQLLGAIIAVFVLLPRRRRELAANTGTGSPRENQAPRTANRTSAIGRDSLAAVLTDWPATPTGTAVSFRNITKTYGTTRPLDAVSLDVPSVGAVGLLGPNGAGKTTLLKVLLGLVHPDSGTIEGVHRRQIGYCPDVPVFEPGATGREVLLTEGRLLGLSRTETETRADLLLSVVGLAQATGTVRGWSRGMRQRLALARALIGRPSLLILDEPTSALDPAGRADLLTLSAQLAERVAVILSTHRIDDVERACNHVIMLNSGRVIATAPKSEFSRRTTSGTDFIVKNPDAAQRSELLTYCRQRGLHADERAQTASLEELFLELTGEVIAS